MASYLSVKSNLTPVFSDPPPLSFVLFCTATLCSWIFLLVHILKTVLMTPGVRFPEPSSGPDTWQVLSRQQMAGAQLPILYILLLGECLGLDTCRKLPSRDPVSVAVTKHFCFFGYVCLLPFHSGQWKPQDSLPQ